ncbi:MAG: hypothetical protein ABSF14_22840 [Terriglobia bacterium]
MNTHSEPVNLQLHVIPSFINTREGACGVCGLPGRVGGLMSVPSVPGYFCCIECVECRLFGPGRCRWCGFALDPDQSAFCGEKCRTSNETSPFGSGKRFALWLSRHQPRLFAGLTGKEVPTGIACLECGDTLDGKRHDSRFCCSKCRKRFNLSHNNPANTKQGDYPGREPIVCVSAGTVDAGGVQSVHIGADQKHCPSMSKAGTTVPQ